MPWGEEPSFIVEMRSRTGFSGSPVYLYIDWATSRMVDVDYDDSKTAYELFKGPWLLGVQWGQLPIKGPDAVDADTASSSMLAVVPCYALSKLLKGPRVTEERREYEERWKRAPRAIPEMEPSTKGENSQHKEDFNRLLGAAVRGRKSDDQT